MDLTSFNGKQELASISISRSSRKNFAMRFHIAGGCKFVAFVFKMYSLLWHFHLGFVIETYGDCSWSWLYLKALESVPCDLRWSLPEIKDCLEEAGFRSVHFWIRQMPDAEEIKSMKGFGSGREVKYEEVSSFEQKDSWNAYVVGVAS